MLPQHVTASRLPPVTDATERRDDHCLHCSFVVHLPIELGKDALHTVGVVAGGGIEQRCDETLHSTAFDGTEEVDRVLRWAATGDLVA